MVTKGGRKPRDKGARGERDIVHLIPGAVREGKSFIKTLVDVSWNERKDVAQVKNYSVGGSTITRILEELQSIAPESKSHVIYKGKRGKWIICQTLEQYLGEIKASSSTGNQKP